MMGGGKPRLLVLFGCLLLGIALVAMLRRELPADRVVPIPPREDRPAAASKATTVSDRKVSQASAFPVKDWETRLRSYKNRNRQELEQRLALLEERVGMTEIQSLNIRRHMEGWYASWEKEVETNRRWSWPDHREIIWARICGSLFASEEQKIAYRELNSEIGVQRGLNRDLASELLGRLKQQTELPSYLENLVLPFLEAWRTSVQGLAQGHPGTDGVSWRDGLHSGDFDPLSEILNAEQLAVLWALIEEGTGPASPTH
ncbi:hypothetical protein [Luteolibacter soli]|uniref:DUF3106 domain-containing protein n=1 Tax=Luteolibacter soli TaxID=3135280 RepID=A0ABU9B0G3_9BACT